jgi:ABC-type transport system substrate-binding protein
MTRPRRGVAEGSRLSQRLRDQLWSAYNHTTGQKTIQFVQQQLAQVGIKCRCRRWKPASASRRSRAWQDPATAPVRMYYVGLVVVDR